jgi:hypothetical protein
MCFKRHLHERRLCKTMRAQRFWAGRVHGKMHWI